MKKNNNPEIRLNGKVYQAGKPKMAAYRKLMKIMESVTAPEFAQAVGDDVDLGAVIAAASNQYDESVEFLVLAFDNPAVTAESIEAGLEIEDYQPTLTEVTAWIVSKVQAGQGKVPN